MKYSELKPIIKKLHAAGWVKVEGMEQYRKRWIRAGIDYWQMIPNSDITLSYVPIEYILERSEYHAKRYFEKRLFNE